MYAQLMGNVVVSKTRVRPVHNASSLHDKERVCRGPGATSQCSCEAGARRHGQPADMRSKLRELEGQLRDCEERKKAAERRASISEEEARKLRETVKVLVTGSPSLGPSSAAPASLPLTGITSTEAQQQMIRQLENEIASSKSELNRVKEECEEAMQKMRSASAKSQAETALLLFEVREENCRLKEENTHLLEQLSHIETTSSDPPAAGNRKLILELSEQVSSLTHELRVAQTTIKGLHSGLGTQPLTSDIGN